MLKLQKELCHVVESGCNVAAGVCREYTHDESRLFSRMTQSTVVFERERRWQMKARIEVGKINIIKF